MIGADVFRNHLGLAQLGLQARKDRILHCFEIEGLRSGQVPLSVAAEHRMRIRSDLSLPFVDIPEPQAPHRRRPESMCSADADAPDGLCCAQLIRTHHRSRFIGWNSAMIQIQQLSEQAIRRFIASEGLAHFSAPAT